MASFPSLSNPWTLISSSPYGSLILYNQEDLSIKKELKEIRCSSLNGLIEVKNDRIAIGSSSKIYVVNSITFKLEKIIVNDNIVTSLCLLYDNSLLVSEDDKSLKPFELKLYFNRIKKRIEYLNEEIKALKGHTKRVSSLTYADDFNYLLSGSDDKTLRIWDTKNIEDIQCIKIIKDMMSPVDFLLYLENRLIVGCEDGLISFIKMNKMKRCRSVKFSNSPIYSINIFHKHRYLLIGNKDGKARVWKIGTNKREVLKGHTKAVTGICDFEDDYIVTTSIDQSIKLWKKCWIFFYFI